MSGGRTFEPKGWTASAPMGMTFPPLRWAVPGVLPEGLVVFAGAPKIGKSWWALGVAIAVANGGVAFGSVPVQGGEVLYLAMEDDPRRLQDRLRRVLDREHDAPPDRLYFEPAWPRLDLGGENALDDWLSAHPSCRVVVVDTFKYVRPARAQRTAEGYDADHEAIQPLKRIADRHHVAVVVIHHDRKAESDDFVDSVSGSKGITGPADTVLVLKRGRGQAEAELHITGRDVDERSLALRFTAESGSWALLGDSAEWAMEETRRRIVDAVRDHEPVTPVDVWKIVGGKRDTVRRTMARMAQSGQLFQDDGRYSAPRRAEPLSDRWEAAA